jgi:hypothetical protein
MPYARLSHNSLNGVRFGDLWWIFTTWIAMERKTGTLLLLIALGGGAASPKEDDDEY